ncbi:MAG: cytochrome c-550 PedF [Burkholderiales bacterium]|nr:cytochrome c-550 PedF [Burkholderiales bacterium]MDE1926758.1 cytochrome c-550 PedF [Burkholderiales bacterium]MDE2502475.1 cytochrome c-550 PedF [Burkholderiales bacterium]
MNARSASILILALVLAAGAHAHGDVTPHPIDTTGLKPLGADWLPTNPYRGDTKAVAIGAVGYEHNCAGCHGLDALSGGVAPDLLKLDGDCLRMSAGAKRESCLADVDDYFKGVVLHGKRNSEGRYTMPAYASVFTQEAVWSLKTYIDARTLETAGAK